MTTDIQIKIRRITALLSDPARTENSHMFPTDHATADRAGLCFWWADDMAQALFGKILGVSVGHLIYVGQAGATIGSRPPKATLRSRIRENHMRWNMGSSTFRKTISAILHEPLKLHVAKPKSLDPESNRRVFDWIGDRLRVAIASWDDRDSLKHVEKAVLERLDPPFNLDGRPTSTCRERLKELRRIITQR